MWCWCGLIIEEFDDVQGLPQRCLPVRGACAACLLRYEMLTKAHQNVVYLLSKGLDE